MFDSLFVSTIILFIALAFDRWLGEPKSWHPLIVFGHWAEFCRKFINQQTAMRSKSLVISSHKLTRVIGAFVWSMAVLPWVMMVSVLLVFLPDFLTHFISVIVLYFCIGWQSLRQHCFAILTPLQTNDIDQARDAVSHIVSRDTHSLTEEEVIKASMESVLENGSDAIFAPIFWFLLAGIPGVLLYRLANTLDAMWGYKNETFLHFGWWAARVDDVLNYVPARLVVLTYASCGNFTQAIRAVRETGSNWKSPNAGPVMAAGAGALATQLGGKASYFGSEEHRPLLGVVTEKSNKLDAVKILTYKDLKRAIELVDRGVWLWCIVILFLFW